MISLWGVDGMVTCRTVNPQQLLSLEVRILHSPPASLAQLVEATGLSPVKLEFESLNSHQTCPSSPTGRDDRLRPYALGVRIPPRVPTATLAPR